MLKSVLVLDAAIGGAIALLQIAAPGWLAELLSLPRALLLESGIFLAGFVVLLLALAFAVQLRAWLVWLVLLVNIGWVLGCAVLLLSAAVAPNVLGMSYLLLHLVTVLLLAIFEFVGLKRSAMLSAAHAAA